MVFDVILRLVALPLVRGGKHWQGTGDEVILVLPSTLADLFRLLSPLNRRSHAMLLPDRVRRRGGKKQLRTSVDVAEQANVGVSRCSASAT